MSDDGADAKDVLAPNWLAMEEALLSRSDPGSLRAAIAAYDQAIELWSGLDLSRPEFCNGLAASWSAKGVALRYLGDPNSLRAAIAAYDKAIELWSGLDLSRPEFRNDLASSWKNRGNALRALGDRDSLWAAIAAHDKAIELRSGLDLSRPEFRNGLAGSWNNKGNALSGLGDPDSLRAAIAAYDQAIELRSGLDLSHPEFRNDLATSWNNKGIALPALRDPDSLRAAIAAYDQAIELRSGLDLSRPEFCNGLATSWSAKGSVLKALGDPGSLRAAIAAYDQAIELRSALDLSRPEFRNGLATSWSAKGSALKALGDPDSLRAAIAAYDQAIELWSGLDLSRPEFRSDLAGSWNNKGNALSDLADPDALSGLGDPDSLRAAIAAYDQAIELWSALDLSRPEFRNGLAGSWNNKGTALRGLGDPDSLRAAIAAYDQAIELLKPLLAFPVSFFLPAVTFFLICSNNLMLTDLRVHEAEDATDVGDAALKVARRLEQFGLHSGRSVRERLFALTLEAYLQAQMYRSLPEVIFDDLDPGNPGSAVESARMQASAAEAVWRAITESMAQREPSQAKTLGLLLDAQQRLTDLRLRHLAGTAELARINAEQEFRGGRKDEAERILNRQIQYRPLDPEGYAVRAELRARWGRRAEARDDLAAACRLTMAMGAVDVSTYTPRVDPLVAVMVSLRLLDISENPSLVGSQNRASLQSEFDKLRDWLKDELPATLLAGLASAEAPALENWQRELRKIVAKRLEEAAASREDLLKRYDSELVAEARDHFISNVANLIDLCRERLADMPGPWANSVEEVLSVVKQAAASQPESADTHEGRERYLETVENALRRVPKKLAEADLREAGEQLATILGPAWSSVLNEAERRYLAFAWRLRGDEVLAWLAPMQLGLAVESSLLERMFNPVRTANLRNKRAALSYQPKDQIGAWVCQYLSGAVPHLYLSQLVAAFGKAVARLGAEPATTDVYGSLASWLAECPNATALRQTTSEQWDCRIDALDRLAKARNDVAHPGHEQLPLGGELWDQIVEGPDAFFRYFPQIFAQK